MYFNGDAGEAGCKILIVDDSDTDRMIYQRYLTQAGIADCSILQSDCGETGLDLCLEHGPDVILLDYLLPDLDGLEFLQTLKPQIQPLPAVIMLTGQGSEQVAVEAMKLGAQDYLVKDKLDSGRLIQSIRRALTQQLLQRTITHQQRQQQLMAAIAQRISYSRTLETVLEAAVQGARQLLDCDRTLIYHFESDMSGRVLAEAVLPGWNPSLGAEIEDTCFQEQGADRYLKGHKTVIADIHNSHLTPCHIELLEQFEVRASIVVPILLCEAVTPEHPQLWGLLIAHHCRSPRNWQADDLALLDDLAVQLAIAIQQNELVVTLQERANMLTAINQLLVKTTETLEIRNHELDEFAYIASHDLKAPLRAIANLAHWLEEDLADQIPAENKKQLDLMQSRVHRMESFIEGLLQYSRAGRQSLEAVPVNTHTLVNDILASLAMPETFHVAMTDKMPILHTQKLLLEQVFANLIGNAIKYHDRPDGQVSITVMDQGQQVEFAIADDGPGIAPEYHERIFGVFQTLDSRDKVESTGIGLSIVKKLVEQQGGTITLRSAVGEGSTFAFSWPKNSV